MQLFGAVTGSHRLWRDVTWADSRERQGQSEAPLCSLTRERLEKDKGKVKHPCARCIYKRLHINIGLYCWNTHRVCIDCLFFSILGFWIFMFSTCYRSQWMSHRKATECGFNLKKNSKKFQKKISCRSSPDGRWNNVLYERGCLLKIITCDIYGFAKIFDFNLRLWL